MRQRRELPGIHFLRIGAALVIAAYHADLGGIAPAYLPALSALAGPAPVAPSLTSLFLTLSGFGLYYADHTREGEVRSATEFWRARAARLLPLMLVGHLVVAIYALTGASREPLGDVLVEAALAATATQSWIPPYALALNKPSWTLSVIAFGYLLYPAIARRIAGTTRGRAVAVLAGLWVASVIVSRMVLAAGAAPHDTGSLANQFAHVFPPIRVLEFASGVVLGRVWTASAGRVSASGVLIALVLPAMLGLLLSAGALQPSPAIVLGYGGLLPLWWALIWLAAAYGVDPGRHRWMQTLGRASFAVYILHHPLLVTLGAMLERGWFGAHGDVAVALWFLTLVPIGVAAERWFVEPVARRLRPATRARVASHVDEERGRGAAGGNLPSASRDSRVGVPER